MDWMPNVCVLFFLLNAQLGLFCNSVQKAAFRAAYWIYLKSMKDILFGCCWVIAQ